MSYYNNTNRYNQPHTPSNKNKNSPSGCRRLLAGLGYLFIFCVILFGGIAIVSYVVLSREVGDAVAQVISYQGQGVGGTPRFYDRHGTLLFELKTVEKRKWLSFEEIPDVVKQATITVEDNSFWTNPGFSPAAIVAAVLYNVQSEGGRPVGASTITQQLVRHIAFDYEERVGTSYQRKVREIVLAGILTQQRSKEDILAMYLNEIYYGNLAYGIEAAAQTYFGKSARDLNLAEAAFLAGLPQAPVTWNPYTNLEGAKARQELILDMMQEDGLITELDNVVAKAIELEIQPLIAETPEVTTLLAPHFVLYVQNELASQYGAEALIRGGWQVTTSLDLTMQTTAEQIVREQVASRRDAHNVTNGTAVILKPSSSEILGMVGSIDYFDTDIGGQINMTISPRQPGSAFKPITYAAAMERGWNTGDVIWDVPIELEVGWDNNMTPVNYDGRYHGPMLMREALANSYNIPPLQLARDVGLPYVIQVARKMGVVSLSEQPGFYGLSLTLGGGEIPLLELTHAFSTLANQGKHQRLVSVLEIRDSEGTLVYDHQRTRLPANQVLDPGIAYILTDILADDQARITQMGVNSALELPFPAAAKTGTTNNFRDNLVVGYTPAVVIGMWYGNNDNQPMVDSSGLRGAAPAWNRLMQAIYNDEAMLNTLLVDGELIVEFPRPSNIEEKTVCLPRGTGGTTCTVTQTELFMVNSPLRGVGRVGYQADIRTNPGAWTLNVLPMPSDEAQKVIQQPLDNGFVPPPPRYCVVNSGSQSMPSVQTRLFLAIPPFYPDEVRARLWGERHGWTQMAPPLACPISVVRRAQNPPTAVPAPPESAPVGEGEEE